MSPVKTCSNQHARYTYILIERTRHCSCVSCGHQFQIHLGSGKRRGQNETDYVDNDMTGAAFAAMQGGGMRWS